MNQHDLLTSVLNEIDKANAQDPNVEVVDGEEVPKELVYGQRMSAMLKEFNPEASVELSIAARAQHIERWKSPRNDYPEGRSGYKKWRSQLSIFHAQRAGEIMAANGFEQEAIDRTKFLIQKRQLKRDPETQTLEDVVCLVFLKFYMESFAKKHNEQKLIDIIQKTWAKMSDKGQQSALKLEFSAEISKLLKKSLS